jgi:hypothetical protein
MTLLQSGIAKPSSGYDIEQSLRFDDGDSAYLSRTPSSAGNRKTWTWSGWVKRGTLGSEQTFFMAYEGINDYVAFQFDSDDTLNITYKDLNASGGSLSTQTRRKITSQVFRDPSAFYHIVVKFQAASTNCDVYVNGEEITAFSLNEEPQDLGFAVNNSVEHVVGSSKWSVTGVAISYFDGYIAEVHLIDGQALTPASFGETDSDTNQWKPVAYSGSYGTNGFYLKFQDSSALGDDSSGNTNDFTATNLVATDVLTDTPTNNGATWNPLANKLLGTTRYAAYAQGNRLTYQHPSATNTARTPLTMSIPNGAKKHIEFDLTVNGQYPFIMLLTPDAFAGAPGDAGYLVSQPCTSGSGATVGLASGASNVYPTTGDRITWEIDNQNGRIYVWKNGTAQNSADPGAGTGYTYEYTVPTEDAFICTTGNTSSRITVNPLEGDFDDSVTTGYSDFSTSSMDDPSIADPTAHFNTVLYTGSDSSADRAITGVGFQPDLVWSKIRSTSFIHLLYDSVRGAGKALRSNATDAEDSNYSTGYLSSFDSDGFSTVAGSTENSRHNYTSQTFAVWNWKAGGTAVSNTDGSITSSVSANTDAGFSIVSWTGDTTSATIGHGLSQAPELIIIKSRDGPTGSYNWPSYSKPTGTGGYINLDQANAWTTNSGFYGTAPTASVFSPGSHSYVAGAFDFIAYCFHGVDGYSKVGSYTGNGSSDGVFIYTGFRPAWLMCKRTNSTNQWTMADSIRSPYNVADDILYANLGDADSTSQGIYFDFVSNGIKLRSGVGGNVNTSGSSYIYLAFAESPFKTSNAR